MGHWYGSRSVCSDGRGYSKEETVSQWNSVVTFHKIKKVGYRHCLLPSCYPFTRFPCQESLNFVQNYGGLMIRFMIGLTLKPRLA